MHAAHFRCFYEEKDTIGKRYRRMDALGTPFCVTVDHQTKEDNTVTIRHRDTMLQERVLDGSNKRNGTEGDSIRSYCISTGPSLAAGFFGKGPCPGAEAMAQVPRNDAALPFASNFINHNPQNLFDK
jgi:hypothetical protein